MKHLLTSVPLVYLVDDDSHHLDLIKHLFDRYHPDCRLRCFSDGAELLFQLTHELDRQLPNLILLDWDMPVLSGHRVLELLRLDPRWRSIPVVILSGSPREEDRILSDQLGSRAFIAKAETLEELTDMVALIREMWLSE
jgi:CheY-like chemotaxis protein